MDKDLCVCVTVCPCVRLCEAQNCPSEFLSECVCEAQNGRENTSFSWHRVLDHLGLIPLFTFNYTANYDGVNGWYYQIGAIKYIFLDYERNSNSLSSGC